MANWIVPAEIVAQLGGGDMERGKRILDAMNPKSPKLDFDQLQELALANGE